MEVLFACQTTSQGGGVQQPVPDGAALPFKGQVYGFWGLLDLKLVLQRPRWQGLRYQ